MLSEEISVETSNDPLRINAVGELNPAGLFVFFMGNLIMRTETLEIIGNFCCLLIYGSILDFIVHLSLLAGTTSIMCLAVTVNCGVVSNRLI